jgi:hypothetical protein
MALIYDLDVAVGVQLDAVGLWVGISRYVVEPLTGVYFSFDTAGLGWDQGVWMGPYDPDSGLVTLDDATYRLAIRTKIAANNWDGSMIGAYTALANLFNSTVTPGTILIIQDNQDMTMTIGLAGEIPPPVYQQLLANGGFPLVPATVGASYVVVSVNDTPLFGFDVENASVSGFDVGAWGTPIT